ncbi:MAG: nuclear transport factor 2 family protein [Actinomycetota bacterium]|nr:MAG: nuclear transport factor 2 family protein [Actinomycetota bacterium]
MELQDLLAIHDICRLKYRYLRALDQKLWNDLADCLTEDATASYGGGALQFDSRAAIMDFLVESMGSTQFLSSHRCTQPEIDLVGPAEATGTWALQDVVVHQQYGLTIAGGAFYSDRYRLVDGRWLISHTGYKRTYEEVFPRASITGLTLTAQWWETNGRTTLLD